MGLFEGTGSWETLWPEELFRDPHLCPPSLRPHAMDSARTIQTVLSQLLQDKPTAVKSEILVVWLPLQADVFHQKE